MATFDDGTRLLPKITKYNHGPLTEPPSLNEPTVIPSEDLSPGTLHLMCDFHYDISTVQKIRALIAATVLEINEFLSKNRTKHGSLQMWDASIPLFRRQM